MIITAGLGSLDDLPYYARAGAEEVFAGYIPGWWMEKYGMLSPLNRREVLYYNVQIGSESEMEILHEMALCYGIEVSLVLNALYYLPEQYPLLLRYIEECCHMGFSSFIIADPALLFYLKDKKITRHIRITISGEIGEINADMLPMLDGLPVKRIIFHRKMTPEEMKVCQIKTIPEYEAFALNENCHFHGGFCNSLHCDELCYSCRIPYYKAGRGISSQVGKEEPSEAEWEESMIGQTGCGLCALWELEKAGITHLKLVGRGNYTEDMLRDIQALKTALQILKEAETKREYQETMKRVLFPGGCSGNCYYRNSEGIII